MKMSVSPALTAVAILAALGFPPVAPEPMVSPPDVIGDRAGFITTLGQDTVALEAFTRTASRVDGDVVIRVPGTVLCRYSVGLGSDGAPQRTTVDIEPLGTSAVRARHVGLEFSGGAVQIADESDGQRRSGTRRVPRGAFPFFMSGFDASYGLYSALGLYEAFLPHVPNRSGDSVVVPGIDVATARVATRRFVRRSPGVVDVDYFGVGWTHLAVDPAGSITGADASLTTEKTRTRRTPFFDARAFANQFATRDRAGHAPGPASPDVATHGTVGGSHLVVTYGSPRRRGRAILGTVVPYGSVWRTGANAATVLSVDRAISIGGTRIAAGSYSLWTLPKSDGSVVLIVNRQHGQWGTDYDASQDVARIPIHVSTLATPQETFTIDVSDDAAPRLRMAWDTFVWSVPLQQLQ